MPAAPAWQHRVGLLLKSCTILRDVMGLTKINFNSCLHNDRLPVTIRFADAVGEIMLAAPQTGEPRLPFKFYI
jgi:hypothetical protein